HTNPARYEWHPVGSTGGFGWRSATTARVFRPALIGTRRGVWGCPSSTRWWLRWRALSGLDHDRQDPEPRPLWRFLSDCSLRSLGFDPYASAFPACLRDRSCATPWKSLTPQRAITRKTEGRCARP